MMSLLIVLGWSLLWSVLSNWPWIRTSILYTRFEAETVESQSDVEAGFIDPLHGGLQMFKLCLHGFIVTGLLVNCLVNGDQFVDRWWHGVWVTMFCMSPLAVRSIVQGNVVDFVCGMFLVAACWCGDRSSKIGVLTGSVLVGSLVLRIEYLEGLSLFVLLEVFVFRPCLEWSGLRRWLMETLESNKFRCEDFDQFYESITLLMEKEQWSILLLGVGQIVLLLLECFLLAQPEAITSDPYTHSFKLLANLDPGEEVDPLHQLVQYNISMNRVMESKFCLAGAQYLVKTRQMYLNALPCLICSASALVSGHVIDRIRQECAQEILLEHDDGSNNDKLGPNLEKAKSLLSKLETDESILHLAVNAVREATVATQTAMDQAIQLGELCKVYLNTLDEMFLNVANVALHNLGHVKLAEFCSRRGEVETTNYIRRGDVNLELGLVEDALRAYKMATTVEPGNPTSWIKLGNMFLTQEKLYDETKALQVFAQGLATCERDKELIYHQLGSFHSYVKQNYREGERYFKMAMDAKLSPTQFMKVKADLCFMYLQSGRFHETIQCTTPKTPREEAWFQQFPVAALMNHRGIAQASLGNEQESLRDFYQALKISEKRGALYSAKAHADALNNIGTTLWNSGDLRKAKQRFEEALKVIPDHPNAMENLGQLVLLSSPPPVM